MDDRRVGQVLRALRRRRRWRQADVASRAGVSQQHVSVMEHGRMGRVDIETLRRVAGALDARVDLVVGWRGPELAQLLDADHAALVETVVAALRRASWEVVIEWSFNHFGERGAVDVLAWREPERALLVIEVKSRVVEVSALHAGIDRKARIAREILPETKGWLPRFVGAVIVLPMEASAYRAVARHAVTFDSSFPARTTEVRRWLSRPDRSVRGLWFLSPTNEGGARAGGVPSRRQRVGRPGSP